MPTTPPAPGVVESPLGLEGPPGFDPVPLGVAPGLMDPPLGVALFTEPFAPDEVVERVPRFREVARLDVVPVAVPDMPGSDMVDPEVLDPLAPDMDEPLFMPEPDMPLILEPVMPEPMAPELMPVPPAAPLAWPAPAAPAAWAWTEPAIKAAAAAPINIMRIVVSPAKL